MILAAAIDTHIYSASARKGDDTNKFTLITMYNETSDELNLKQDYGWSDITARMYTNEQSDNNGLPTDSIRGNYGKVNTPNQDAVTFDPAVDQLDNEIDYRSNALVNSQGNNFGQLWGSWQGKGLEIKTGENVSNLQNIIQEWITSEGTVIDYVPPQFTLTTRDNKIITPQLGNMDYIEEIGLNFIDRDAVVVTGYYDVNGSLAIGRIMVRFAGHTFTLQGDLC